MGRDGTSTEEPERTTGSPLRLPAFRWFFAGRLVSLLGSSMAPVALAFGTLEASGSAGDMGLVLAAQTVSLSVFALAGGVLGDRYPRRTVLLVTNLGAGAAQAAVAFLLLSGGYRLGPLMLLTFLNGALSACANPALRGIVPDLVGAGQVRRANALLGAARNATRILGPTAGAVIVATAGGGWAIAADAAAYLLAALCLARLDVDAPLPPRGTGVLADLREGWAEFRALTWVWVVVASFGVTNVLRVGIWTVLGPLIARGGIGETAWGVVLSVRAVGLLVASAVMYRTTVRHLLALGTVCVSLMALPLVALGLGAGALRLAAAAFVAGLGAGVFGIAWETSLQEHVPRHLLSRISAYDSLGSFVAIPLGQLAAVPLATVFGASRVALVGGVLYAVFALAPLLVPSVRRLRHGTAGER